MLLRRCFKASFWAARRAGEGRPRKKSPSKLGSVFFLLDESWLAAAGALFGVAAAWAEARLFAGVVALSCFTGEVRRGVSGSANGASSCFAGDMVLEAKEGSY
jgi:hypothetical protein